MQVQHWDLGYPIASFFNNTKVSLGTGWDTSLKLKVGTLGGCLGGYL